MLSKQLAEETEVVFGYVIFKVIYAPHKAFKEIAKNPKYFGPALVMILFVIGNVIAAYALLSKTRIEQTMPIGDIEKKDEWTENASLWRCAPGAEAPETSTDCISSTHGLIPVYPPIYYGNRSIRFSINNSDGIWMQLENVGPIGCSGERGYNNVSLRIKRLLPYGEKPQKAMLYLHSARSDYFYYDFTDELSDEYNVWDNITIQLRTQGWQKSSDDADWGNIIGLTMEFKWDASENITLLVDGIFFRGAFSSPMVNWAEHMLTYSTTSFMQFIINWVFLTGLIYVLAKAFQGKALWKTMLILVGCALITLFIQILVYAAAFSSMPTLYYTLELLGQVEGESEKAYSAFLNETEPVATLQQYVNTAVSLWTVGLCAIAVRVANEFSWGKSAFTAAVAYYASNLIMRFLLG